MSRTDRRPNAEMRHSRQIGGRNRLGREGIGGKETIYDKDERQSGGRSEYNSSLFDRQSSKCPVAGTVATKFLLKGKVILMKMHALVLASLVLGLSACDQSGNDAGSSNVSAPPEPTSSAAPAPQEVSPGNTEDKSMTEKLMDKTAALGDKARDAYDSAKDKSKEYLASAKEKGSEYYDKAKEKGSEYYETAKEKGSEYYDKAKEKGSELYETAKEKGGEYYDKAKEKTGEYVDKAKEKIHDMSAPSEAEAPQAPAQ